MKDTKMTMKSVKERHVEVLSFGYCELYGLLYFRERNAYTKGVYGWNADIYSWGTTAIVTGYRPFGKEVKPHVYQPFENEARLIIADRSLTYEEQKEKVENLLAEMLQEVTK